MEFEHICDSLVGHPWNVSEVLEDVVVYRFTNDHNTPIASNSGKEIKWVHGIKESYFISLTAKEIKDFSEKYGKHIYAIHIKYGEVVGVSGWDVTFLPEAVVEFIGEQQNECS